MSYKKPKKTVWRIVFILCVVGLTLALDTQTHIAIGGEKK
jgi:hypothetical protein